MAPRAPRFKIAVAFAGAWILSVFIVSWAFHLGWIESRTAVLASGATAWIAILSVGAIEILSRRIRHHVDQRIGRTHAEIASAISALADRVESIQREIAKVTFDPYAYWQERAQEHGRTGVGDLGRPRADFEAYTEDDKRLLIPFLKSRLHGNERRLLDFGCGFGRFTHELSRLVSEKAVGVDATPEFLEIAHTENRNPSKVSFHLARGTLPFPDREFDILWVSYVLIHIVGAEKTRVISELLRVLRPGGLLFLVEGVTTWRTWSPHCDFKPFEWYQSAFRIPLEPYLRDDLRHLSQDEIRSLEASRRKTDSDLHLVMTGRKPIG